LTGALYWTPTIPLGREVVVTVRGGALIVMVTFPVLVCAGLLESVTVTDAVKGPAAVGVPVTWPAELMESPAGRPVAVKLYGVVPPEAVTVALYAVPTVPFGREVVVSTSPVGAIVMVTFPVLVCAGLLESVTVTDAVNVPAAVGVPVIWPLGLMDSPAGRPVAVKLYGMVPPVAVTVAL